MAEVAREGRASTAADWARFSVLDRIRFDASDSWTP
jgi:hypothetical protein